ncbi:beta-glucoside-specific PTS transporter subunit IIABC [Candidatus Enterococcus ferrettii]|uniref:PTS system, beta-glucoside-specific IIA component n=1 Tax=Candidatus Enterococcus ferrettii TaxID=2815324 RepID=A0ABV0ET31_9ENTE|nr:beta-glucoside-specific PTS transporter subunit IIABC [Enterococcus sp. 665A]MBO1342602.1 PTS glucose transporter subunit IIA [Enterococcus sp. 665A]
MNDKQLAEKILELSGGNSNITGVTHCMTRLRLSVKDNDIVRVSELEKLPSVLGVNQVGSNQLQIILGGKVKSVHEAFVPLVELDNRNHSETGQKVNLFNRFLETISGIFSPVLPVIIGAGLVKGILFALMFAGLVQADTQLFSFLNIFSDAGFYFLPIFLAYSAGIKFKCNPYLAAMLAAIMLHPDLVAMMNESSSLSFLGIPIVSMSYGSSVIPIIFGVLFMSYVERFVTKLLPAILRTVFVPLLTILITAPIVLATIGPFGKVLGDAIGSGIIWLYLSPFRVLAGALVGGFMPFLVMTGMHNGFGPIALQTISKYGVDYILALQVASNSAQAGSAWAVFFRTKNKEFKQLVQAAAFSATLGITEPALFGVHLKLKKTLGPVVIGGAVGGAIAAYFKVTALGVATGPIIGLPLFIGKTFVWYVVSFVIAFIVAFILTNLLGFEDVPVEELAAPIQTNEEIDISLDQEIFSPLSGEIVPLENVKDNVFSQKMMGDGVAILPSEGKVVAPFSGIVEAVFETKHAIGLKSYDGCELLIHVGLDTVELEGIGYTMHVRKGDTIFKGELLLEFDKAAIQQSGYDLITPIIVTNSAMYELIETVENKQVKASDSLMKLIAKRN